jgi:ActR/RegA family two-component response regulator
MPSKTPDQSTPAVPPLRVLFVDDEETIRLTLPAILQKHGYAVEVTATVAEALAKIASQKFDVLIADLNVGQPGDGFTVVSAMRRTQPACVNFILTGYPAFETALQAIRAQVDDYLLKPIRIPTLVQTIEQKIKRREPHKPIHPKRVATILWENSEKITAMVLAKMKAHPELTVLGLTDQGRIDHIPKLLKSMVTVLESPTQSLDQDFLDAARKHGRIRLKQGYALPLMVEDAKLIDEAVYEVLQDNLLSTDLSRLIPDLRLVNGTLESELKESLKAYSKAA